MRAIFMSLACVAIPTHERGFGQETGFSLFLFRQRSFHARRETVA